MRQSTQLMIKHPRWTMYLHTLSSHLLKLIPLHPLPLRQNNLRSLLRFSYRLFLNTNIILQYF